MCWISRIALNSAFEILYPVGKMDMLPVGGLSWEPIFIPNMRYPTRLYGMYPRSGQMWVRPSVCLSGHTDGHLLGTKIPNKCPSVRTFHSFRRVASGLEKSGKFDIFSRSGNCQGILNIGQWKIKILKSQGKIREK